MTVTEASDITTSEESPLLVTKDGPVTILTLNRPDRRNAINRAMRKALKKELWRADGDDDARVVVITGAGTSFSSGVDLPEALSGPPPRTEGVTPTQVLRGITKPVIAAVNGPCYTGGYELAVNCSFIIASDRAEFADTHAQIGLLNGWGGSACCRAWWGCPPRSSSFSAVSRSTETSPHGSASQTRLSSTTSSWHARSRSPARSPTAIPVRYSGCCVCSRKVQAPRSHMRSASRPKQARRIVPTAPISRAVQQASLRKVLIYTQSKL